jgi:hypothetical protein
MLILFSILILLITSLAIGVMQMLKLRFAFQWLIVASGTMAAWLFVVLTGLDLPQTIPLVTWQPENLFPTWPTLLVDKLSWPYALVLATLALAVILTDIVSAQGANWKAWMSNMVLTALGMLVVLAGNPLTLMLAWVAIDLMVLLVLLGRVNQSASRERLVVAFSACAFASMLVIIAEVLSASQGQALTFTNITNEASVVLLLAAGLRLGVLPLHIPFLQENQLERGFGTISRLVPVAAGLILLGRITISQQPEHLVPIFLGLAALAAVYSSVTWVLAKDELEGCPAWIVGMASLSFAAAVQGQAMSSLSWGLSGLLGGGLLFLFSIRNRWLIWFPLVGIMAVSALPYTPNWNGAQLYSGSYHVLLFPFILAHSLLLVGFARHALRPSVQPERIERWVWFIYPLGLVLILATLFFLGFWMSPPAQSVPLEGWFAGLVSLGLAGLIIYWGRRRKDIPPDWAMVLISIFSLRWLYRIIWSIYRYLSKILSTFTKLLEGEGGVLWAILLLGLLFSIISRLS